MRVDQKHLPWMQDIGRPRRLAVVLSSAEVAAIFSQMSREHLLFAQLLYGAELRLTEGL
jgi:hypothetical protein